MRSECHYVLSFCRLDLDSLARCAAEQAVVAAELSTDRVCAGRRGSPLRSDATAGICWRRSDDSYPVEEERSASRGDSLSSLRAENCRCAHVENGWESKSDRHDRRGVRGLARLSCRRGEGGRGRDVGSGERVADRWCPLDVGRGCRPAAGGQGSRSNNILILITETDRSRWRK